MVKLLHDGIFYETSEYNNRMAIISKWREKNKEKYHELQKSNSKKYYEKIEKKSKKKEKKRIKRKNKLEKENAKID